MSRSVERFITRMKLTELRRQREKLRAAYQRVAEQAQEPAPPGVRLRRLARGLQEIRFAQTSLHEDVKHLPILARAVEAEGIGEDVTALWQRLLEEQLAAGRLRSEFVYVFGALLEEWTHEHEDGPRPAESDGVPSEAAAQRERLLEFILAEPEPTRHQDVFDEVFRGLEDQLQRLPKVWEEQFGDWMSTWLPSLGCVGQLQRDIYQSAELRRDARRFGTGGEHHRDFTDALALMAAGLPEWEWPAGGVPVEAVWTRNKWRLYPRLDLPTACLWAEVGDAWQKRFSCAFASAEDVVTCRRRLRKLRELNAPEVIVQNEIRMLRDAEQRIQLPTVETVDPWEDLSDRTAAAVPGDDDSGTDCIVGDRLNLQEMARRFRSADGYGYGTTNWSILLTHAEVQLARAAFPNRPVYVVKVDLKDFFPSLSHEVLLDLLERLRLPEAKWDLVRKFLAIRVQLDDAETAGAAAAPARRGVPMGFVLSGFLADLLLQFMERFICLEAAVRIVRQVDDITILSPTPEAAVTAWQRLKDFCTACGLRVNEAKCGAVCVGPGQLPDELPGRPPFWGMLRLDESGDWAVHEPTFEAHLAQSRERVLREESILSQVRRYNADVTFLLSSLAMTADLGDAHYEAITEATRRFHGDFFGPGQGIVSHLAETVRQRYLDDPATPVPESWIHWPVTAGGLGLRNPVLEVAQYPRDLDRQFQPRRRTEAPTERPADWQHRQNVWLTYYRSLTEEIAAVPPHETPQMKALVKDFIDRGKAISGGQQTTLSTYWQWVLSVYGPEILARFGTFRFLITELVPLQLISGRLLEASSLGE